MYHFQPMKGLQAFSSLLNNPTHGFHIGRRTIVHPLRQCLPINKFRYDIEEVTLTFL